MSSLKIAVASDFHAYDAPEGPSAPSHLSIQSTTGNPGLNPARGLQSLIESERLEADLFLCPGDLTDQAHPGALVFAWQVANDLGIRMGTEVLACATGNHDVDSRFRYNSYSPTDALKELSPSYPLPTLDLAINNQYWSRGFAVIEKDTYRLLVLNSSGHHGAASDEFKRGRVGNRELTEIDTALKGCAPEINILLCHHHPHQHMEIGLGEDDIMRGGQLLLDLLGSGRHGRWLVIHGHKHHPKISYASGGSISPVVFAAGSISAQIYPGLGTVARNQFYVLTVSANPVPGLIFGGTGKAWDWAAGTGWKPAGYDSGLPHHFGFGYRADPAVIAHSIADEFTGPRMEWIDVVAQWPQVEYLLPHDLSLVLAHLASDHGINVDPPFGQPLTIGRSK